MSKHLLRSAAETAGITEEQAVAFVKAIIQPTQIMCQAGTETTSMGALFNSEHLPADWQGLTGGAFDYTIAATVWRRMAAMLLAEVCFAEAQPKWPHDTWQHPSSDLATDWQAYADEHGDYVS